MKILIAMLLSAGCISAQAQLGIPAYNNYELAAAVADMLDLAKDLDELRSLEKQIPALSGADNESVRAALVTRRREIVTRLDLRAYRADEEDRRLIHFLQSSLAKEPKHPWAADWRAKIAAAQKRLLRDPSSDPLRSGMSLLQNAL